MKTNTSGKAIAGIALTVIMVASVMAVMIGCTGAYSAGRRYNVISEGMNNVLIGQDIIFDPDVTWTTVPPVITRYVSGDLENTYTSTEKDGNYWHNRIF